MQRLIYIRRSHGISKKDKPYDMIEVSNGISSFTLGVAEGVGEKIEESLEEHQEFLADVHVETVFGSLRGTIADFKTL